jgi:hypothetical protein
MNNRPPGAVGGQCAVDQRIESSLWNIEGACDGGAHRNFEGDDDTTLRRLDDPTESTQRDVAIP